MNTPRTDGASVRIGALVPLTRPGWTEAGRHLLAGLELAVSEVNEAGGIDGSPVELVVRDTAADPQRATAAVDELAGLGVAAVAGEYHSVVARTAAARADALGLPFLCSSAVLDALTEQPTQWVARLSPPQSRGWRLYADFLLGAGHSRIAVAAQPSLYWAAGTRILRDHLASRGGTLVEIDMSALTPAAVCDELVGHRATALLLLAGHPEPSVSIVRSVRRDQRLAEVLIGAPAGQPESAEWAALLGDDGAAVPFLRYLPERLTPSAHGSRRPCASGWPKRPPSSPSRATTPSPSSPMCCVLTARTGHAPPHPGRASRSTAPGEDPVLPRAGHQRLAVGFGAGPGRRPGSGGTRPLPGPSLGLNPLRDECADGDPAEPGVSGTRSLPDSSHRLNSCGTGLPTATGRARRQPNWARRYSRHCSVNSAGVVPSTFFIASSTAPARSGWAPTAR